VMRVAARNTESFTIGTDWQDVTLHDYDSIIQFDIPNTFDPFTATAVSISSHIRVASGVQVLRLFCWESNGLLLEERLESSGSANQSPWVFQLRNVDYVGKCIKDGTLSISISVQTAGSVSMFSPVFEWVPGRSQYWYG